MIYCCIIALVITLILIHFIKKDNEKNATNIKQIKNINQYIIAVNKLIYQYNIYRESFDFVANEKNDEIINTHDKKAFDEFTELVSKFTECIQKAENIITYIKETIEELKPSLDAYAELDDTITFMGIYLKNIEDIQCSKKDQKEHKQNQNNMSENQKTTDDFFSGCNTINDVEARYKALAKVFHPDCKTGDNNAFKILQDAYEVKKGELKKRE